MAFRLTESEIRHRLTQWRNLKQLHQAARGRIATLLQSNIQLKADKAKLKQIIQTKDKTIRQLRDQLADKEVQRKELLGFLYKETKKKEGKQQRKPRQQAYHRPEPKDEDITDRQKFILNRCPMCSTHVGDAVDEVTKYEEDIDLRPRKTVKAYTVTRHWCPTCETFVKSQQTPAIQRIGLNVLGYILYGRYRLRLPINKIQESLRDLFDFGISEGEIAEKLKEAETMFGKDYEAIGELIKTAKVVYADETGWRMDGESWWLWVFVTDQGVRYLLEGSRGGGVPREALGGKQDRVLISDGYKVYDKLPGEHQQCWVHLLRAAKLASPLMYADIAQLYVELGEELLKPLNDRDPPRFTQRLEEIRIFQYFAESEQKLAKARVRIKNHADTLLTCLRHMDVLPENNTAERAIRPQVVMRKIFGGSRSPDGARAHEVNTSVIETKLKQNPDGSFFEVMLPLLKQRHDEQSQG
jgi:transposase